MLDTGRSGFLYFYVVVIATNHVSVQILAILLISRTARRSDADAKPIEGGEGIDMGSIFFCWTIKHYKKRLLQEMSLRYWSCKSDPVDLFLTLATRCNRC